MNKVNKFRMGTADPEDLFASFNLPSAPNTMLSSGQQTPLMASTSILYKRKLGAVSFGIVMYGM